MQDDTIFRFRNFPVYKDALEFRKKLKALSKIRFPKEETYGLRSQLWRALDSIVLNIAEGPERNTDKDFSRFLNASLASVYEVVACLDCALDDGYIDEVEHVQYSEFANVLAKQLKAFLAKVRRDNRKF